MIRALSLSMCCLATMLSSLANGQEKPLRLKNLPTPQVTTPAGAFQYADLRLTDDKGKVSPLHLAIRDTAVTQVYLSGAAYPRFDGLKADAASIKGDLLVGSRDGTLVKFTLEAGIKDGIVTGAFTSEGGKTLFPAKGTIGGTIESEASLRKRLELARDASWPSFLGPTGDFRPSASSQALVTDLKDIRLLWRSEALTGHGVRFSLK